MVANQGRSQWFNRFIWLGPVGSKCKIVGRIGVGISDWGMNNNNCRVPVWHGELARVFSDFRAMNRLIVVYKKCKWPSLLNVRSLIFDPHYAKLTLRGCLVLAGVPCW